MSFYPSSLASVLDLLTAVNNLSTTLSANITAIQTTIPVISTSDFPASGRVTILKPQAAYPFVTAAEVISYTSKDATNFLGVTRGEDGTSGVAFDSGDTVGSVVSAKFHNIVTEELVAALTDLRNTFSADLDDAQSPATTASNLKGRLDHFVTQFKLITGETDWKTAPDTTIVLLKILKDEVEACESALNDGATPASTAATITARMDQVVSQIKLMTGGADWFTAPAATIAALKSQQDTNVTDIGNNATAIGNNATDIGNNTTAIGTNAGDISDNADDIAELDAIVPYRRPILEYIDATTIDVEQNTPTTNNTQIVFPDKNSRALTEDTSSTHKYRRWLITATAEFTSGTEDSGLRSGESEAANTWYALYAVKSLINSANFVIVGTVTQPTVGSKATLDGYFGANSWVYLGMVRNGPNIFGGSGGDLDLEEFTMNGNMMTFDNGVGSNIPPGIRFISVTAITATYTPSFGSGAAQLPGTATQVRYNCYVAGTAGGAGFHISSVAGNTSAHFSYSGKTSAHIMHATAITGTYLPLTVFIDTNTQPIQIACGGFWDAALASPTNLV